MDARPFRPARPLPATNNENLPPAKQNIHQRHKSTGNLRVGGLQVAAKRTAFADKSNTVKSIVVQDDDDDKMTNAKFRAVKAKENNSASFAAPKDAFLRPAQRPSSKGVSSLPSAASHGYIMPLVDGGSQLPMNAASKPTKRASTIIYNDKRPATSGSAAAPSVNNWEGPTAPTAVPPYLRKPRHHQSQPVLKSTQRPSTSLLDTDVNSWVPWDVLPVAKNISGIVDDDLTEAPYLDAVEELSPEQLPVIVSTRIESAVAAPQELPAAKNVEFQPQLLDARSIDLDYSDREDEEFYDDQGYTTAHSYRSGPITSHCDNREPEPSVTVTVMDGPRFSQVDLDEIEMAQARVEKNRSAEEIEDEAWDISMVAEYGEEIFEYMRELENTLAPTAHYMDIQTEIQWSMRSVLMDWVVQVHGRFSLLPETLFLAVNYIDRFLSVKVVSLGKLQLVGATAIFLAAKYEEINCPSVMEIVYMVDKGYTVEEILKAERYMLSMLNFELGWPGPMSFLRRISKADDYDLETRTLAKYFLEVTIMDERFVASRPSFLAAGAHCLSRLILEKGVWTQEHVAYSGYTYNQLSPLITMILECCTIPEKHHQAVFEKYSDKRFKKCAIYVLEQLNAGFCIHREQAALQPLDARFETFPYSWGSTALTTMPSYAYKMPIPLQG